MRCSEVGMRLGSRVHYASGRRTGFPAMSDSYMNVSILVLFLLCSFTSFNLRHFDRLLRRVVPALYSEC
jgi:hypothetical protein